MSTDVELIKEKLDIADVIGSYIKIDKAGANYKARCPFHNEKTPSFHISPERKSFYCFGCQAKGDIFSFVEKFESVDFSGALKILAHRAGVTLQTRRRPEEENQKDVLYALLEETKEFFKSCLASEKSAHDYVLRRGLTQKTIDSFEIGYAPGEWRALKDHLMQKGFKESDMALAGVIKKTAPESGKKDGYYDVFRGRIMFPINDSSGRVIAFTGRTLDEEKNPPKYLNSPETALFQKSKVLFALDKAKHEIRRRDYSILVEGQMDCIMLHQAGFTNSIAASGTAFTEDASFSSGLGLLTRLSENIVVAFDSDNAGQKAAKRIVPTLSLSSAVSLGMNIKIVHIEGGKDPADIIKEDPKLWVALLEKKKHFIEFLVDSMKIQGATAIQIGQLVTRDIFPFIHHMPGDVQKYQAVRLVADKLGLGEDALWKDLQAFMRKQNEAQRNAALGDRRAGQDVRAPNTSEQNSVRGGGSPLKETPTRREAIERNSIGLLLLLEQKLGAERVVEMRKELARVIGEESYARYVGFSEQENGERIFEAEHLYLDRLAEKNWEKILIKEYELLLLHLEEEYVTDRWMEASLELRNTEKKGADPGPLLEKVNQLAKRREEIKNKRYKV